MRIDGIYKIKRIQINLLHHENLLKITLEKKMDKPADYRKPMKRIMFVMTSKLKIFGDILDSFL